MLRSVYALALGLLWLPRNIFGLGLLVFDSIFSLGSDKTYSHILK